MQENRRALIFAHYHQHAGIRSDTVRLLEEARHRFQHISFVSTHLGLEAISRIPSGVSVHVRNNIGRDFYSYRVGMLNLMAMARRGMTFDEVHILNSSFLCFDPVHFFSRTTDLPIGDREVYGITKSYDLYPHLQSFFYAFRGSLLQDARVQQWWSAMPPLDDRQQVILQYEIGFSKFLTEAGYALKPLYDHTGATPDPMSGVRPSDMKKIARYVNAKYNPYHTHWKSVLREFSIVKIEFLRDNPLGMDLQDFIAFARAEESRRQVFNEGMEN